MAYNQFCRATTHRVWVSVVVALLLPWQAQHFSHSPFSAPEDGDAAATADGGRRKTFSQNYSADRRSKADYLSSPQGGGGAAYMTRSFFLLAEAHQSLYSILGVSRSASLADIKKAFRAMSKKYHPDKNKDPSAETHFKQITHAYEVLTNTEKRKVYDAEGLEGLERYEASVQQGGGGGGDHPFGDIFGEFFGFGRQGGGAGGTGETPQVPASTVHLKVSLEQLYRGDTLNVSFTRPVLCDKADDCYTRKAECRGPGIRVVTQQMGPGFIVQNQIQDDSCVEQGKAWKSHCKACPNGITQKETVDLLASVEPGMKGGDQIVFEGVGEQRLGFEPADLVLIITELPHKRYTRSGDDLEITMQLSLMEALVGFEQNIIHLDSTPVTIKRTDVTYDGLIIIIPGKGMPRKKNPSQFGNLRVKFHVVYPVTLNAKQKAYARQALEGVTYMHPTTT